MKKLVNVKTIGGAFLVLMLLLIFLSQTIYNYNLPEVTAAAPMSGKLSKLEVVTGSVDWADYRELYAEFGGKIENVSVKEGDSVTKGSPLISMSFNEDDIDNRLKDIAINRSKTQLDIETTVSKQSKAVKNLEELQKDVYKGTIVSEYEVNQALNEIEKAQFEYDKLKQTLDTPSKDYELAQLQKDINKAEDDYNQLESKQSNLSDYDLQQLSAELEKAEGDLQRLQTLFATDAISRQQLEQAEFNVESLKLKLENLKASRQQSLDDALYNIENLRRKYQSLIDSKAEKLVDAEYNLHNLRNKYENLKKLYQENKEQSADALAEKEKNRQKQIRDYQHEIEALNQELKAKELELINLDNAEQACYKTKSDHSQNMVHYAPEDITVISVMVSTGQHTGGSQLLLRYAPSRDFIAVCTISPDNNFVTFGDTCKMQNIDHLLDGIVTKITPFEGGKEVLIAIESTEITAGETFEIKFEKESTTTYTIVPNGAVNRDSDGYFVYQVKRRDGLLGKEFYAEKLRVYIGDNDLESTAIISGIEFFEPLVILSDKPFEEGEIIKVKNEVDFFAS